MQGPRVSPLHTSDWEVGESTQSLSKSLSKEMPSPTPSTGADPPAERWAHCCCLKCSLLFQNHTPPLIPTHAPREWDPARGPEPLAGSGCISTSCSVAPSRSQTRWEVMGSEAFQCISQAGTYLHVRQKGIQWLFCGGFPALLRHNGHITLCTFKVHNMMIWYTMRIYNWKLSRKNEIAVNS